jgi:hypothetical protein
MTNIFDGILDGVRFHGTDQYSQETAEKAAIGAAQTSVMNSDKRVVEVSQVIAAESPVVGLEGKKFAVPKDVAVAPTMHVGWDTDGEADDIVKGFIFDPKGLAAAAGLDAGVVSVGGTFYSGENNAQGVAKHNALNSFLCDKKYIVNSLRIRIRPSANAAAGYVPVMDDLKLRFIPVDEKFNTGQISTIDVGDQITENQRNLDLVTIPMTGVSQLLTGRVVVEVIGAKDTKYDFKWTIGLRY